MPNPQKRVRPESDLGEDDENRHGQVGRFFSILNLLEHYPKGLSVKQINAKLYPDDLNQQKKRTLYRDLKYLRTMFPLEEMESESVEAGGNVWRYRKSVTARDAVILTPRETLALYLARQVLVPLRATPFVRDLEELFKKIDSRLGARNRARLEEMRKEIIFEPGPAWGLGGLSADVLDTVQRAVSEGHNITCVYDSASSQTSVSRRLGPHYIRYSNGALYLRAEDLSDGKIKTFGLARMKNVEMTIEAYEGHVTDPEKDFEHSFGLFRGSGHPEEIVIQFAPEVSPYVREHSWHASQQVLNLAGGKVELRLNTEVTVEIVGWVMKFGPKATVLQPESLVEQVKSAAAAILKLYEVPVRRAG